MRSIDLMKKRRRPQGANWFPVDEEIAIEGARLRHERDWYLGDALIYGTAIREGAKVLAEDTHFEGLNHVIFLGNH